MDRNLHTSPRSSILQRAMLPLHSTNFAASAGLLGWEVDVYRKLSLDQAESKLRHVTAAETQGCLATWRCHSHSGQNKSKCHTLKWEISEPSEFWHDSSRRGSSLGPTQWQCIKIKTRVGPFLDVSLCVSEFEFSTVFAC
jgi:hypothetical protein